MTRLALSVCGRSACPWTAIPMPSAVNITIRRARAHRRGRLQALAILMRVGARPTPNGIPLDSPERRALS